MDRNAIRSCAADAKSAVALRKESVDRNSTYVTRLPRVQVSLSARRAWIEICNVNIHSGYLLVALRKESVDRNSTYVTRLPRAQVSLSARRAWIEMRKITITVDEGTRRSPQGERG